MPAGQHLLLAFAVCTALCGCAPRAQVLVWQPAPSQVTGLTRLAILDFDGAGESGKIARAALVAQFGENHYYSLVDPAELSRVRSLVDANGVTDVTAALEAARQQSVDALLTGQVVSYNVQDDNSTDLKSQGTVSLAIKLIDVQSGEIRAARQFTHTFDAKRINGQGSLPSRDAVLTQLLHECARDTVALLAPHHQPVEVTLAQQYYGKGLADVSRGNDLAEQGNWDAAAAAWKAALTKNKKNHVASYNLALAAEARQDYSQAFAYLDAAIKEYPATLYNQTRRRMREQQREFLAASMQAAARKTPSEIALTKRLPPVPESAAVHPASYAAPAVNALRAP